jgi:hypothetical protein
LAQLKDTPGSYKDVKIGSHDVRKQVKTELCDYIIGVNSHSRIEISAIADTKPDCPRAKKAATFVEQNLPPS